MRPHEDFSAHPRRPSGTELFERDAELELLGTHLDSATAGEGAMVAVVGPAGIGKSSLLLEAREAAAERELLVLGARGGELERDYGFGVARQLFEDPLARLSAADRRAVLSGAAARAAMVVGSEELGGSAEWEDGYAVLHALYWLTANLAHRSPCLLIVDDLHWADTASVRFLAYLQRRIEALPAAILIATRPAVEASEPDLLEAVIQAPGVIRVVPEPLSEVAVASLLAGALERVDSETVSAVLEATSGNPFLCRVAAAGLAEGRGSGAPPDLAALMGESFAALLTRRLGPLGREAEALARAVAVLGSDAPLRRAALLAGLDEPAAVAAADGLAARGIFEAGPALEFTHPLVRAGLRDSIPASERAALHARAAELLDDEGSPAEAAAVHLLAAPATGLARPVRTLRAAARAAAAKGDPSTAAAYLRRALAEPPPADERAAIEVELGEAELNAGEAEAAIGHLEAAASEAEGTERWLRRVRLLAMARSSIGDYEPAVELLRAAVDPVAAEDRDLALRLEGELFQCAMMLPSAYARISPRLEALGGEIEGTTPGERSLLTALATEACLRTESAGRVRDLALRAFDRGLLDDRAPYSIIWTNAAFPLVFAEGFAEVEQVLEAALDQAAERTDPVGFVRARAVGALLRAKQGSIAEAESDGRRAIEIGAEAGLRIGLLATGPLVEALLARGAVEEADAVIAALDSEAVETTTFMAGWALMARARVRLAQGRLEEATADLRAMLGRESGWHPWNPAMFPCRSILAEALWRLGEGEEARALAERELELAEHWGAPGTLAASLRTLGRLAADDAGLELLRRGVDLASASGARLEHARSLYELGAAIRRGGRRAEAREPLHEAMEIAHRCGATVLSERAREELVLTGSRPRRAVRTGVDALTPSERRVAGMAARGMTNREIAQELFVTVRTVQVHLTATYRKLEISSREEIAAALGGDAGRGELTG